MGRAEIFTIGAGNSSATYSQASVCDREHCRGKQLSAVLVCTEITGFAKCFGNFEQRRSLNLTSELRQKRY
jgi:hypothetical protein